MALEPGSVTEEERQQSQGQLGSNPPSTLAGAKTLG